MAGTATLVIKVVTDTKAAMGDIDASASKMDRMRGHAKAAAVAATAIGAGVVVFGKKAFDAASATEQAMGGMAAVFGKSTGQMEKWAEGAADSAGLAKDEYAELATVIGAQLKNMGVPMGQLTTKTNDLVKKGADLAATFGGTTKEAVSALSATLRGETDPIERYGVSIKQVDIQAALLETTTKRLAREQEKAGGKQKSAAKLTAMAAKEIKKMTPEQEKAAKAAATLGLIEKQTASSRGKFAKEANTAAGQQQRAAANMRNAMAEIGAVLLPVVTKAASLFSVLAKWMQKNAVIVQILGAAILALVVAVYAVNVALWVMAANPVTLWVIGISVAVAALVAGLIILYKRSATARKVMDAVWRAVKSAAKNVAQAFVATARVLMTVWRAAFSAVKSYVQAWMAYFRLVFGVIRGLIKLVVSVFKGDWRGAMSAVRSILSSFRDFFRSIFQLLPEPVQRVIEKIKSGLGGALTWLKDKASGLGDVLSKPFDAMRDAIDWVIDKVNDLIGALSRIKVPKISLPNLPGPLSAKAPAGFYTPAGGPSVGARSYGVGAGARAASAGGGLTINVTGALDPEAVARQIQRVLVGHDRRMGGLGDR